MSVRFYACQIIILLGAMLASGAASLASVVTTGPFYVRYGQEASAIERAEVMAVVVAVANSLPDSAVHLCSIIADADLGSRWRRDVRQVLINAGIEQSRIRDTGRCSREMAHNQPSTAVAVLVGPVGRR
ncbi:hypothetical protein [Sphingomonas sp.]|uniref:hypothetical protein n=1 Tax=Sphingomonas sp. TaxID=28214 RepID=UPI003F72D272